MRPKRFRFWNSEINAHKGVEREMGLRLGLVGVGSHCRNEHLPALKHLLQTHSGKVELRAVCDLRQEAADAVATELGFQCVYTELEEFLQDDYLDAVIAVTPTKATAQIATRIMEAGLPLLMEKPLGANLDEARQVVEVAARTGNKTMVSLNRRFEPALRQTSSWLSLRKVDYVQVCLLRKNRREEGFIEDVIVHPLDALRGLLGPLEVTRLRRLHASMGVAFSAEFLFSNGTPGLLECLPAVGNHQERYDFYGSDFHLQAEATGDALLNEQHQIPQRFARPTGPNGSGTYGESVAFVEALLHGTALSPTPSEAFATMLELEKLGRWYRQSDRSVQAEAH
jgi:predicted dehydrogenase